MATATIFDDLKADHDRHRAMLNGIADAAQDDRAALFEAFRVDVTAHAAAEEETLYATMLGEPNLREEARHSVAEHKELDDLITEVCEAEPESAAWMKAFRELRTRYDHHITEEEEEMFPAASAEMSAAEEKRLAELFEARKAKEEAIAAAIDPTEKEEKD